jgi:hypothetical protein
MESRAAGTIKADVNSFDQLSTALGRLGARLYPPRIAAFRACIEAMVPCEPKDARKDLEAMPFRDLLHVAVQWMDRGIYPRPRVPALWEGFYRHGYSVEEIEPVRRLAERCADGMDLTPYISEEALRCGYTRRRTGRDGKPRGINWDDKDYVLNAFGVHHLHLSASLQPSGFAKRTERLAFVQFSRDQAVFLMVGDHKSFDDGSLAQAIAESRVGTQMELKGILLCPVPISPPARRGLNRRGVSTFGHVGDSVVLMDVLSTAGTSVFHTRHADQVHNCLINCDPLLDDPATSKPWFDAAGCAQPETLNFEWQFRGCDLCAVETNASVGFVLVQWRC